MKPVFPIGGHLGLAGHDDRSGPLPFQMELHRGSLEKSQLGRMSDDPIRIGDDGLQGDAQALDGPLVQDPAIGRIGLGQQAPQVPSL
jgi:hypothetical protein